MLVLTRRSQEAIQITVGTTKIVLYVVESVNGKCRLGFEAPPNVVVDRMEVAKRKELEGDRSR